MTNVKLVETAILKLNEAKKTGIKIISIKEEDSFIDVIIKYPKSALDQTFGFTPAGFDPNDLRTEGTSGMINFFVPNKLRETNPAAVIILRFAYYFGRYGLGGNYI